MKPNLIKSPGFLFGIPETKPRINGFRILCRRDKWVTAAQGDKEFLIEQFPRHYRLTPMVPTELGMPTRIARDKCLSVPR